MEEDLVAAVMDGRSTDSRLTRREGLALEFAGRFWQDHHGVDGPLWSELMDAFNPEEFMELAFYTAQCMAMGKILAMLGVPNPDYRSEAI